MALTNTLGARSWSNIAIRESPSGLSLRNGRKTLRGKLVRAKPDDYFQFIFAEIN